MDKHFLAGHAEGAPGFSAEPWYNPHGDCIVFQMADEAVVAERVDEVLTIYRSAINERPIGFQIKGVRAIIQKFGLDGLACETVTDAEEVRKVSVTALLTAALLDGPTTPQRRAGYVTALDTSPRQTALSADELIPA